MKETGAVILTGGKSRRMGSDKAMLHLKGKPFLELIAEQTACFDEVLLSVDKAERHPGCKLKKVEDKYPETGPIGGIYSALLECRSERLLVVGCDMPLFTRGLAEYLCDFADGGYDAYPVVTRARRIQPLCAVYSKSSAVILEEQIKAGNYRLSDALDRMRVKPVPLRHSAYSDETVQNINTAAEYSSLLRQVQGPPIIAVCGIKNSGKTTLLANIIPRLCRLGLRVAVIKHDGHDFLPDVPGTDSFRLREAGAYGAAVYSENRFMITMEQKGSDIERLARHLKDADIILAEGGKHTALPKIEIVRRAVSGAPACDPQSLLALCSDIDDVSVTDVPKLTIDDYDGVVRIILAYLQKEKLYA